MILDHPADLFKACRRISPINPDYANLPTRQGFNWFSCLGDARFGRLYLGVPLGAAGDGGTRTP
jgi:hypothetical protein